MRTTYRDHRLRGGGPGIFMRDSMRIFQKKSTASIISRFFMACFVVLQCLAPSLTIAGDNDQEILNQLYREIVGSSPAGNSIKIDSLRALGKALSRNPEPTPPLEKIPDLASERLTKEIDKIVRDAQIRHSDAVKFIQDAK
jgi:hypothetical protein